MKKLVLYICLPLLFVILERVLKSLKSLFCNECVELRSQLISMGFHPSLCSHPSILFYGNKTCLVNRRTSLFLFYKLKFLVKSIKIGLLKLEKGHKILQKLEIPQYYGWGLDFWFLDLNYKMIPYQIPDVNKQNGNVVVYTVLTGDYDNVNEILYKEEGIEYLLFTNNRKTRSTTWTIVFVDSDLEDALLSREIKMLAHQYLDTKYDASIYIDANAVIYGEIAKLTNYLNENISLVFTKHSQRNTVWEEIEACVSLKGVNADMARKQYLSYLHRGFKDDTSIPLAECGIIVRNHNDPDVQELMRKWFVEYRYGIKRDQISIIPTISLLGFEKYLMVDGSVWHNQFNKLVNHK